MSEPNRDELIAICERAFVPQENWSDRDTAGAQRQLGECYALLKAGCDFVIRHDMSHPRTIWVAIEFKGFGYFDYDGSTEEETYYLPTVEQLDRVDGRDWY